MARIGWEGHGLLFVRALEEQLAAGNEATALTAADAIGMDEFESANVMGWLIERDLVREVGQQQWDTSIAYTMAPLELTAAGRKFAESGVAPPSRGIDPARGLRDLGGYL